MTNPKIDTDVLIVGAGPVGLFLALECSRRGLRWRIIEARSSLSLHSKALAIFPRTLEIFDMAGIVDPFLSAMNPVTSVRVLTHGRTLAHIPFTPEGTPYPFVAMVPQNVTERLLSEQLQGEIEYDTTLVSAEQQSDSVQATIHRNGRSDTVIASFLVGCDGAHSAVRHLLGLPFDGGKYAAAFLLADVDTNEDLPADEMQLCPHESGPLAIFPMSRVRRRIVATIDRKEGDVPSLELVRGILARRGPKNFEARALHWSSYFQIHHRNVPKLRVGRIFLAGDAAHIHSPFGGQGMNTGLQDAWNLVWKLDRYLRGEASDALLDTYSAERIPIIKGVIRTTDFMTRAMGTSNRVAQAARNVVIPIVSHLPQFRRAFVRNLSQFGVTYNQSGTRYFDESMRGGGVGRQFMLFANDVAIPAIQGIPESIELRRSLRSGLSLVRPDGYVCWSGNHFDRRSVIKSECDPTEAGAHKVQTSQRQPALPA